jgi:hypothetical protein
VYVNPTDQTLSIGDVGLVEIHLPGVSSIEASDFVFAPAAAPVLAESAPIDPAAMIVCDGALVPTTITDALFTTIAGDGALLAAASSTAQTTNLGDGIDAMRDEVAWIDDPRSVSFDEARTESSEHTVDDTVITLPSGQSVHLPHVSLTAQMETGFSFDHVPAFDRADATGASHDAVMHGPALESRDWILPSNWKIDSKTGSVGEQDHDASSQKNLDSTNAADAHGHMTDFDSNPGGLKASENGGGNHSISSEAGKHGAPPMHGTGVHDVEPSSPDVDSNAALHPGGPKASENGVGNHSISSAAGKHGAPPMHGAGALGLGDSFHFKDETSGSGIIGLAAPDQVPASVSHHDDAAETHGPLAVGPQTLDLALPVPADDLSIVPDQGKSHLLTHVQHDLIV